MRPDEQFDDETASSALTWAGGAAVTVGIVLALAAAQSMS
jgi:hypothetical protein